MKNKDKPFIIAHNMKEIRLSRNPLPGGLLDETFTLPDEIKQKLPMTPDHIEEARRECVYTFLRSTQPSDDEEKENAQLVERALADIEPLLDDYADDLFNI